MCFCVCVRGAGLASTHESFSPRPWTKVQFLARRSSQGGVWSDHVHVGHQRPPPGAAYEARQTPSCQCGASKRPRARLHPHSSCSVHHSLPPPPPPPSRGFVSRQPCTFSPFNIQFIFSSRGSQRGRRGPLFAPQELLRCVRRSASRQGPSVQLGTLRQ